MLVSSIMISFILSGLLLGTGVLVSKKSYLALPNLSPFECGFSPKSEISPPVSIHFFILALVFLIFDTELIILFPFFLTLNVFKWMPVLILILVLNFLSLGLFYEWSLSLLEWFS